MKLLWCRACNDVVKLDYEKRTCHCRNSSGWYHDDGWHATVVGRSVEVIGLDNNVLRIIPRNGVDKNIELPAWKFSYTGDDAARITRKVQDE